MKAKALGFTDLASELISWLRSKTLVHALIRETQAGIPGKKAIKSVIRPVLTRWTMHYQSYQRLGELCAILIIVIEADEDRPISEHRVVVGDTKAKAKVTQMVWLIRNPSFWNALTVYVVIESFQSQPSDHHM